MNLQIRLFRKPFTTVLWAVLVMAMTVLLCVGCALWYSSERSVGVIDGLHQTVAYRTDRSYDKNEKANGISYQFEDKTLSQQSWEMLESMDCVEGVYPHTLTGGYIPSITAITSDSGYYMIDESYDDVILVATVTGMEIEEDGGEEVYDVSDLGLDMEDLVTTGQAKAEIHVEEYLVASETYIGIGTARETYDFSMPLSFLRKEDRAWLQEGQRYLIHATFHRSGFGSVFMDLPVHLRIDGNSLRGCNAMSFAADGSDEAEGENILKVESWDESDLCIARLDGTLEEFLSDPVNAEWVDIFDICEKALHSVPILGTESLESMYAFTNNQATVIQGRSFTQDEYDAGARVCMISSTLAEQSGIQVGDVVPISQFWCVEEYQRHNIGNYSADLSYTDGMLNNPTVGHVGFDTEFLTDGEEFTVVGIYRLSSEWTDSSYSLTPNTVFIPQKAQIPGGFGGAERVVDMTYTNTDGEEVSVSHNVLDASWGVYLSIKLENGRTREFQNALAGTELENQFIIVDQGYSEILGSVRGVAQSARQLLILVAAGWALLLLLYLLLYQGMQKRNLGIMRSLGATPKEAGGYLWSSGMTVAAAGILLGTAVSAGVMNVVQKLLFQAAIHDVPVTVFSTGGMSQSKLENMLGQSQLPLSVLLLLAVAQILIFAAALWLQSKKSAQKEPRYLLND